MTSFDRLAACAALVWVAPSVVFAQQGSIDLDEKMFVTVSGSRIVMKAEDLRFPFSDGFSSPALIAGPEHGTLQIAGFDEQWTYVPDAGFFGRDSFTFSIGEKIHHARLYVNPALSPVAGRWPTEGCRPATDAEAESCPSDGLPGQGAELGWYDALKQTFYLCDWEDDFLGDCGAFPLPENGNYQTWTPFTVDRDGDGWHELAVRNPRNGDTRIFEIRSFGQGVFQRSYLVQVEDWAVGGAGDLPMAGSWYGDKTSEMGLYRFDPLTSRVGGLMVEIAGQTTYSLLGSDVAQPSPLAGDWLGEGQDRIGVYDRDTHGLHFSAAAGGPEQFGSTYPYDRPNQVPVAGRASRDGRSMLALFEAGPFASYFYVFFFGDESRGPLPLQVTVDPSGPISVPNS